MIERIQESACRSVQKLLPGPVNVIFYDCTTLYFESFVEDDLKQYGYSKDMKFNQKQILVAVMVTSWGLPIGYEVYEGSRFEGDTLQEAIEKIEKQYKINQIIFVADSAMLSKENVKKLERLNKRYVLGARLKNMPEQVKKEILSEQGYRVIRQEGEDMYKVKEITYQGKRLIVTYSSLRARKDAHERQKAIERLLKKLKKNSKNPKGLMSNYGYKRYVKIEGESRIEIDQQKVEEAARWDGIHGVITNDTTLRAEEILEQYHDLWQIEETFRIGKHDLEIGPIFHWTPGRIKAHIAICFMALCLVRHLQYRMRVLNKPMSVEAIRRALTSVQISILKDTKTGKVYGLPSSIMQEAKELYKAVGKKIASIPFLISG